MKKNKIISLVMSFIMIFGLIASNATTANAEDVTSNGLAIAATNSGDELVEGTDYSYSSGKWTISTTKPVTISMKSGVTVTDDYIVIDTTNGLANVTLDGVNIKTDRTTIIEVIGDNATAITVKGQNSIVSTSTSNAKGIYSKSSPLRITGTEVGQLSFSGTYSAIEGYKAAIDLEGNWKLKVTDATFGVFLSPYSSSSNILNIRDNVNIEMSEIDEHAIYNKYGKVNIKADEGEQIVINTTTDAWCIYGHGIDMEGKVTVTAESTAEDGAIYSGGDDNPIHLSGNVTLNIDSVKNGLTAKGDISILKGVNIDIACTNTYAYGINCNDLTIENAIVDIESNGYASITADAITVKGTSKLKTLTEVDTSSSRYGIMYENKIEVSDSAEVFVTVKGKEGTTETKMYAIYGSSSNKEDALNIKGNAKVTLDGGVRTIYYTEDITLTDSAQLTIKNASEYGIHDEYGSVSVAGSAKMTVSSAKYGVRSDGGFNISNNAEVLITGDDKAIYSSRKYQVTPDNNKAYEVSVGKTKDTAEVTTYYEASGEQSTKSGMTYFYAVSKSYYEVPTVVVDYKNETLSGFANNATYTVNGEEVAIENGVLAISAGWLGTTISIVRKGDANYAASKAQSLAIASRGAAPTINGTYGVSSADNTKFAYTITPVENAEYKMDDGKWQDSNVFDGIEPLSTHTFSIRIKATDTVFASETASSEEITFEKLDGSATVSLAGWMYGNKANDPVPSSDTNGTDKVTYLYKESGADDGTYSDVKPTEPGAYIVKATFAATETYNEVVATAEFTIKKSDKVIGEVPNVDDITDKNVKVEDKKELEEAKTELEKNLEKNKDNYTEDVKESIQKEINRINETLKVIENVENVEKQIGDLPDNITLNDAEKVAEAQKVYDSLSTYEKTLVDAKVKAKLDAAVSAVAALKEAADSPKTGDFNNFWMMFVLLFVSGVSAFGIAEYEKKRK